MRLLGVVWFFIKRLFCAHDFIFVRNIYGDEILEHGYKRSVWKCKHCGRVKYTNLTEDEWVPKSEDSGEVPTPEESQSHNDKVDGNHSNKKYLVLTFNFGELYVSAEQLIRLYGVDPKECIILPAPPITPDYYYNHVLKNNKNLIVLKPRLDGNYTLEGNTE